VKSVLLRVPRFQLGRAVGRAFALPASLTVSVLYACNSRCRTCHVYENKAKVLRVDEYDRIFRSLGRAPRWVTLSGGEPFLRRDLAEIATLLHRHCRPAVINFPTNGTMPDRVEAVIDEITTRARDASIVVNVSLDEIGERHDELRGFPGNWDRAQETLAALRRIKARKSNLTIGVHTVVSRFNEERFPVIAHELLALEPDSYIAEIAEQRVELGTTTSPIPPSTEGVLRAIHTLRARARRGTRMIEVLVSSLRQEYYRVLEEWVREPREVLPCFAAITSAHLMPEGKVWACCVLGETLGDVHDTDYDFPALWYGATANRIRARIKRDRCHCPLANQAYLNVLVDPRSLTRAAVRAARSVTAPAQAWPQSS
jgi:MoaA/NifB/PqqE/SkfB family radical SAM enzyme